MKKNHSAFQSGVMKISCTIISGLALSVSIRCPQAIASDPDKITHSTSTQAEILDKSQATKLLQNAKFSSPRGWQWNNFKNADCATIRYGFAKSAVDNNLGTIVLVPGFTEFAEVFFETATDFLEHGYDVYIMDWRGSGGSDRFSQGREKAISLGFDHDENDLDQFLSVIVKKTARQPIYLVAHSLGGHIALRYLHDHHDMVAKAVLSAPPLDCAGTQAPPWAVSFYSWLMCKNQKGFAYTDKQGDWAYMAPRISKVATHSHDPVRVRLEEAWCVLSPTLRSGGATWQWLWFFQQSCDLLNSANYTAGVKTPLLVGCATADHIADPKHETSFAEKINGCKVYSGKDARHELFLEEDSYRQPWMNAIYDFLKPSRSEARPTK